MQKLVEQQKRWKWTRPHGTSTPALANRHPGLSYAEKNNLSKSLLVSVTNQYTRAVPWTWLISLKEARLPSSEDICIGMKGHRGSHRPENHRQLRVQGKASQTSQQSQRTRPPARMPTRGLHELSEHHVQGGGVHPALWSHQPNEVPLKIVGQGLLTDLSTCVAFTLRPLLNSPAPFLTSLHPLSSKSVSSEVPEWPPPMRILTTRFLHTTFLLP